MPDPPPSSSAGPIRIAGYEQDTIMSKSVLLTLPEVLKRRSRRLKHLCRILDDNYWYWCMEELRSKTKEYYWNYGSPFVEEEEEEEENERIEPNLGIDGENRIGNVWNRCEMRGCKVKAMALTKFCFMHVLHDPNQKLYKECAFAIKSSTSGPILCGKPVLRSTVPCYCPTHFRTAEKYMLRALKKSGPSVASTSRLAPKLHVIVSEYVRQIQQKRRQVQREVENAEIKVENKF